MSETPSLISESLETIGIIDDNPRIQERLLQELTPVLEQNKDLLNQAAEALRTSDPKLLEEASDAVIALFKEAGVELVWDGSQPRDNQASLDFKDGKWILKRHPVMSVKDSVTLKEYMHEWGAYCLITQRLGQMEPEDLDKEKSLLNVAYHKNGKDMVATTHVFDQVLKLMAQTTQQSG